MPGVEIKKVKAEDDGMRLNRWFMKYYPNLTLGRLQKLLRTKQIKVDGKRAETSLKLAAGSEVRVPPMDEQPETGANRSEISRRDAEFILSLVIYKDDNIIVLNKPSGLAVQGGTNTSRHVDGMLEALRFELNEKPKLVHRIDKDTSGVLVLARNRTWADRLTKAFREHTLPKTYLALVNSCPKNPAGEIKAPLEKCGEKSLVSPDGKPAATVYKTLDEVGRKFALVEASPLTGRIKFVRIWNISVVRLWGTINISAAKNGKNTPQFRINSICMHTKSIYLPYIIRKQLSKRLCRSILKKLWLRSELNLRGKTE